MNVRKHMKSSIHYQSVAINTPTPILTVSHPNHHHLNLQTSKSMSREAAVLALYLVAV